MHRRALYKVPVASVCIARMLRRFERVRQASDLDKKSDEKQANALIYVMGDEADDILKSFHLSKADTKKYKTVKERFDEYFIRRRNVIYERAKLTNAYSSRMSRWTASLQHYTVWQNIARTVIYTTK